MKTEYRSVDRLERELVDLESLKSRITARQLELVRELDVAQVASLDGSKTLGEWLAGRLDMEPRTAHQLVRLARSIDPRLEAELADGLISTGRASAETDLAVSGATDTVVAHSRALDIQGVRRLRTRTERLTPIDEAGAIASRRLVLQPNLDESEFNVWGRLPGFDGRIVSKALQQRADHLYESFPNKAPADQRMADAFVSVAQDSLDRAEPIQPSQDPLVTVFVDATGSAHAHANADASADDMATQEPALTPPPVPEPPRAWVDGGVRVGPHTLEQLLCLGAVEVITVDEAFNPIAATPTHRAIPPKLRRAVLARDGGCVIDSCSSTHRLQPHHITPASQGGHTIPDNLATLCWYHHHIVIHGQGRQLDPTTPPQRRRFLRPPRGPDPP